MKKNLVFWIWNDTLDPAEICRQIDDMHSHGIDGFFIHPMPDEFRKKDFGGGMPGYLSDEYFAMYKIALEHGKNKNMQVWLYDEGGWPSGTVNGQLLESYPHLRMHRIFADGTIAEYPKRPDFLNPETTKVFISMVHEKYKKHFGKDFGKTIPGIFTDEPFFGTFDPPEFLPWSPVLAENFKKIKGFDIEQCLQKIFRDNDPQSRCDYAEVWVDSICSGFLNILHKWCNDNNLLFTGHFNGDDTPKAMLRNLGADIFKLHQHFDIPGCDVIWRQIHPLIPENDFTRLTVSAAKGKNVLSETFGVYGPDLSLAEMKFVANMQFIGGLNTLMPMAIHYSNRGGRMVTTASHIAGVDTRWEKFNFFSDFQRRMGMFAANADPVIKLQVPFPVKNLQAGSNETDSDKIFPAALEFAKQQITYEYTPNKGNIPEIIEKDIQLLSPCPALRTRHVKARRTERRLLVNSGMDTISFSFTAPAGHNVWFDPGSGRRETAVTDINGNLSLTLPFAGAMILLTLPGKKVEKAPEKMEYRKKIPLDFKFSQVIKSLDISENGLTTGPLPDKPGEDFCGTVRYTAKITSTGNATAEITLPEAQRAMVKLLVNGKDAGSKVWMPYRWEIRLEKGENLIEADISNTPGKLLLSRRYRDFLEEREFFNSYIARCYEFEKFLPDEKPLENAFIKY